MVFDEAHNIDNVCIEALSVNLRQQTLDVAGRNDHRAVTRRSSARSRRTSGGCAQEYDALVNGLAQQGVLPRGGGEDALRIR